MHQIRFPQVLACALAAGVLVSGCGGGGASPPAAGASSSGFVVDGYLRGATVLCDANGNGSFDAGEASVTTDSSGFFRFAAACSATLVAIGGTSTDTNVPFPGKLKAPAGSSVVTPLTSLLVAGLGVNEVNASLGVPFGTDLRTADPALRRDGAYVNSTLYKRTLAFHQLALQMTEVFAALATSGGAAARPAIYSEVVVGMASAWGSSAPLVSGTTFDATVLTAMVNAAAQRVTASGVLSTEVRAGAASVNAAALAQVVAGALKAQGEALAAVTDALLVATTTTLQTDTQIATFVLANRAQLTTAPGAGTQTLATNLTTQVVNSLGGVVTPPPPPTTGTLLVSFDEASPAFSGMGAYGGALPDVVAGPTGGSGNALRIVKPAGGEAWGGIYFGLNAIPFTADRKTISARVYSTRPGAVVKFKVEATDTTSVEVASAPVASAGTWQTLTWTLTGVDIAKQYTVVAITPDQDVTATGQTYYVDQITLDAAATVVVPPPPAPGTCSAPACVDFSGAGIGFGPFENQGGGTVGIVDEPGNAGNKVVAFVKKPGDGDYFGTTITGLNGSVVLTPTAKTVTLRVFSPAVGTNFLLKFEGGTGGPSTTEKDVATTTANQWETLSFVMPDAGTFGTVVLFPNGRAQVAADKTMYIDDLKFPGFSVAGGGGGAFTGSFATDFVGDLFANSKSTQGGDVGFFFDQRLVDTKAYDYAGLSGTAQNPGGVPNFYFGLGLNAPAITDAYFGAFVKAPANGAVDVAGFSTLKLAVWGPDQLFQAGAFPTLRVVMQGAPVPNCASPSGASEVQASFTTTTQGAASVYSLPLSSFTVAHACNGESAAQILAAITQLNVLLLNTNIQYLNKDPNGVAYTNGLNIGPIKFE